MLDFQHLLEKLHDFWRSLSPTFWIHKKNDIAFQEEFFFQNYKTTLRKTSIDIKSYKTFGDPQILHFGSTTRMARLNSTSRQRHTWKVFTTTPPSYVSNARGMTVVASHTEVYSVTGTTSFYKFSWCSFYYFNILV